MMGIFNIGNSQPVPLMDFIIEIEKNLNIESVKDFQAMQPGDVEATAADTTQLKKWVGYQPKTTIEQGVKMFIRWYKEFYNIK